MIPLFVAKLQFFASMARQLQPFLKTFQTDATMVPFLAEELHSLVSMLMTRFIKEETIAKANTATKMLKLDIEEKHIQLGANNIDLGFSTKQTVKNVLKDKLVSELKILELRMEGLKFLTATTANILEKCPL